jgi:outer membrane lipoprotein-sorting protein
MTKLIRLSAIAFLAIFSLSALEANYIEEKFSCSVALADIKELNNNLKDPSFTKEQKIDFRTALKSTEKAKEAHKCK